MLFFFNWVIDCIILWLIFKFFLFIVKKKISLILCCFYVIGWEGLNIIMCDFSIFLGLLCGSVIFLFIYVEDCFLWFMVFFI